MRSNLLHTFFGALLIGVSVWCNELEVPTKMEWKANNIVPDIIDIAPKDVLEVTYANGIKVNLGNELTPTQVKAMPQITWKAESNAFYTVLFLDPDVPSRKNPTMREVRHWLIVNIKGNNVSSGTNLYEYIGAGPGLGTGLHRYTFLVFKQKAKILTENLTPVTNRSLEGRLLTKARDLIKQFNLEKSPIAGNFFKAQYDDYSPILQKQFERTTPKNN